MTSRLSAAEYRQKLGLPPAGQLGHTVAPKVAKAQIRLPAARSMNKTEAEWMRQLQSRYPRELIMYEPITFRLASGTRYTPDFMVAFPADFVEFWEVKGAHIHNSASIRAFKEARSSFPMFSFHFAQKTKNGWATA